MYKSSLALAVALGVLAQQAGAAGFVEDSKLSLSSRTMYYDNNNRDAHGAVRPDQRETGQGFKLDYISGFTEGTVGFGVDAQALWGIHLDGGRGYHKSGFMPDDSDGSSVSQWARFGANAKARFSKTEAHFGSALAPNLPILVANDGRVLPQTFEGGTIQSKEIDNLTVNAGQLTHAMGRASSNRTGLSVAGATADSNKFRYGGLDYKLTPDLTLQYYYSNLEDFYKQHFLGATHVFKIADDQSFKTDLRYFDSSADGRNKNGGPGEYNFNNNGGYEKTDGKVDNKTWSAMFTYTVGGHALMLGHQQVGDDGGFVWLNQGNVVDSNGRNEGAGGSSFYLFTDSMINQFARAGENTTFGQYSYDFAALGVPGLKASVAYLRGDDIRNKSGDGTYNEWERDARVDYTIQQGTLKGLGFSLRQGVYRGSGESIDDQDQTRFIVNYTYSFL
ncbi:Porin D [Pseudomonas sp. MM223]|nr:Porin D [Pseudomonas sp. MM223]